MQQLTAHLRLIDHARAYRTVIAWMTGDKEALDAVLDEVTADPIGAPSLLFALADAIVRLFTATGVPHDDVLDAIRADLLHIADHPDANRGGTQ